MREWIPPNPHCGIEIKLCKLAEKQRCFRLVIRLFISGGGISPTRKSSISLSSKSMGFGHSDVPGNYKATSERLISKAAFTSTRHKENICCALSPQLGMTKRNDAMIANFVVAAQQKKANLSFLRGVSTTTLCKTVTADTAQGSEIGKLSKCFAHSSMPAG